MDATGLETLRLREEGSAVRIQAVVRGHQARQRVQWITEDGMSAEHGHRRARARAAAKARGDPYCRRLECRSSYSKLRNDIAGILLDALVEVGSSNAQQHADDWAVREVLGDAVAAAARRHAIRMGTDDGGRRNSIEEMRKQQQELEARALRRHRLTEGHADSDKGSGNTARYLSSSVQPVLAKSLLAYDMEDPRPRQMSETLGWAIQAAQEEGEPPSITPGVVQ